MRLTSFLALFCSISSCAVHAATTNFTANIVDGSCEVTVPNSSITFDSKAIYEFPSVMTTVEVRPLIVDLNCEGTEGLAPVLNVTGEAVGLADPQLFRSGGSVAQGVGFMLKEGTFPSVSGFYTSAGTVAPGDSVAIAQSVGVSSQIFTVGLVRGANEAPPTAGAINAKISFSFAYP